MRNYSRKLKKVYSKYLTNIIDYIIYISLRRNRNAKKLSS